jgi:hypothetical protein
MKTYELNGAGLAAFSTTLTADTYVLVEATITTFAFETSTCSHFKWLFPSLIEPVRIFV